MKQRKSKYDYIDKETLTAAYEACGRSISKTAEHFGMSNSNAFYKFKKLGVEYDKNIKHSCNHNYFNELGERQMYWLGILLTDGCVQNERPRISLGLATKDIYLLEQFRTDLEFTGAVHTRMQKSSALGRSYSISELIITSKPICDRLADFGIVPRKTYIAKFPDQLKTHPLVNHFVRGCIDGDGCIREIGDTNRISIEFCGTKEFVEDALKVIQANTRITTGTTRQLTEWTWEFFITGARDAATVVEWVYRDATIFMPRKHDIAIKVLQYIKDNPPYEPTENDLRKDLADLGSIKGITDKHGVGFRTVQALLIKNGIEYKTTLKP